MMRKLAAITAVALIATSCNRGAKNDVLTTTGVTSVARTTECTVPNADGVRCDVKTCKADQASDCAIFQDRCTESGHNYEGDKNSGTCTRGTKTA